MLTFGPSSPSPPSDLLDPSAVHSQILHIEHDPSLDFLARHTRIAGLLRERILRAAKFISAADGSVDTVLKFYTQLEACCAARRQWGQQSGCLLYVALAHRRNGQGQKSRDVLKQAHVLATQKDSEYLGSILASMSAVELAGEPGSNPAKGNHARVIQASNLARLLWGCYTKSHYETLTGVKNLLQGFSDETK